MSHHSRVGQTLLFVNVRLIDPATGLDRPGALLVRDGRIVAHGPAVERPDDAAIIDGGGAILCPGLVDLRAVPDDAAAAAGGVTTVARLSAGDRLEACATEGETATRLGLPASPAAAEAVFVAGRIAEGRHVGNLSTEVAIALVRDAKARGQKITADTSPAYFDLNETAIGAWDSGCRLSPPLRDDADRVAVLNGLRDGTIDAIASDHTPVAFAAKDRAFERAAPGGVGLSTLLALTLAHVHNGDLRLMAALALLTCRPARVLNIDAGTLAIGAAADLCLFDPDRIFRVRAGELPGLGQNTPWDGRALEGRVLGTWVGGMRVLG